MYEWVVQTVWLALQNAGILTYNELSFVALTGLIVQLANHNHSNLVKIKPNYSYFIQDCSRPSFSCNSKE